MTMHLTNARGETVEQCADRYIRIGGPAMALSLATRRALTGAHETAFYQSLMGHLVKRSGDAERQPSLVLFDRDQETYRVVWQGQLVAVEFTTSVAAHRHLAELRAGTKSPLHVAVDA